MVRRMRHISPESEIPAEIPTEMKNSKVHINLW